MYHFTRWLHCNKYLILSYLTCRIVLFKNSSVDISRTTTANTMIKQTVVSTECDGLWVEEQLTHHCSI